MPRRSDILLSVLLVVTIVLCGCSARTGTSGSPERSEQPGTQAAPASIELMAPEQKVEALGAGFPVEVPVPASAVADPSRPASGGVFTYTAVLSAPVDAVAAWYRQVYAGRDWKLTSDSRNGDAEMLVFSKGKSQTEVQLTSSGDVTSALVTLGLSVPVGDTF